MLAREWSTRQVNIERAQQHAEEFTLAPAVARALSGRDASEIRWLLDDPVPPPTRPWGMDDVAQLLSDHLTNHPRERIGIIADYDTDGACAAAIIYRSMIILADAHHLDTAGERLPDNAAEVEPVLLAPKQSEGYGVKARMLDEMAAQGVKTIIILDSGSGQAALIDPWMRMNPGIAIAILDHHEVVARDIPKLATICNPWARRKKQHSTDHLAMCTGALAELTVRQLLADAEERATDDDLKSELQEMLEGNLVLAGVATIADMQDVGKSYTRWILGKMGECTPPPLIQMLAEGAEYIDDRAAAWDIAPALNTGKRWGLDSIAARALCLRETDKIKTAATFLKDKHTAQKGETSRMMAAIMDRYGEPALAQGRTTVLVAPGENHEGGFRAGFAGLAAQRLRGTYGWPTIVLVTAVNPDGQVYLQGSGRSSLGFDLGRLVRGCVDSGMLLSGGGHKAACGLSLWPYRLEEFRAAFAQAMDRERPTAKPSWLIDTELTLEDLHSHGGIARIATDLERFAPWGQGHWPLRFGIYNCAMGGTHRLENGGHVFGAVRLDDVHVDFAWWGVGNATWEAVTRHMNSGGLFDVCGKVEVDKYGGRRKIRMTIDGVRFAAPSGH